MIKQVLKALFFLAISVNCRAHVDHVNISKITSDSKLLDGFRFVKENQNYYSHWTPQWEHNKPKQEIIKKLREVYQSFENLKDTQIDLSLLQGDIAHYLYNLDDTVFFKVAVEKYETAKSIDPKDFRSYWFLGYHYSQANVPMKGIENLLKAKTLLPVTQPVDFWNDYAWATAIANMPANCLFAMDRVRDIDGRPGHFENQLGNVIKKRIVPVDKAKSYPKEEIWDGFPGKYATLLSRPLGLKVFVDSTWNISIFDYQKNQGVMILKPNAIKSKQGREINYTIAMLIKTAEETEKLEDYLNIFIDRYKNKKQIGFSEKYEKTIAYEVTDPNLYKEIGGARLYLVGVERNEPRYPGLILENPFTMPKNETGGLSFYQANESKDRFKGRIFYAIMLDSCEFIHEESFKMFKALFEDQLIIE